MNNEFSTNLICNLLHLYFNVIIRVARYENKQDLTDKCI